MGAAVWEHAVEAFNTATESENRMHDDAVAATFGFAGGLVPGVDVWAYLTRPCVDRWGEDFLVGGTMQVRFRRPVYDGEFVRAVLADDGRLALVGPDGERRADGAAEPAAGDDEPLVEVEEGGDGPADPRPAASRSSLAAGTVLPTLRLTFRRDLAVDYLRDVRDDSGHYRDGTIAHPGFFARLANAVLHRNVRLGPWIHVETTARHHHLVHDGAPLEVRGAVRDEYERAGHRFVDLDVDIRSAGTTVWSARHRAIWRPRAVDAERA